MQSSIPYRTLGALAKLLDEVDIFRLKFMHNKAKESSKNGAILEWTSIFF
jgi:hypothetical protein